MVMRPFFAPRVTFTRVSKASDSRVESAGRGVLRARKTLGWSGPGSGSSCSATSSSVARTDSPSATTR